MPYRLACFGKQHGGDPHQCAGHRHHECALFALAVVFSRDVRMIVRVQEVLEPTFLTVWKFQEASVL